MYDKDRIVFESELCADFAKIESVSQMVCENCMVLLEESTDATSFFEAADGFITTIKNQISAMVQKIKDSFNKAIDTHKKKAAKKKLDKLNNLKLSDIPTDKQNSKVEAVDLDAVAAMVNKCEQFTVKAIGTIQRQMKKLMNSRSTEQMKSGKENLDSLIDNLVKQQEEFIESTEEIADKKTSMTVKAAYKMYMKHKDIEDEIAGYRDRLASATETFNDVVSEAKSMVVESVNDILYEQSGETASEKKDDGVASVKAANGLWSGASNFQKKAIRGALTVVSVYIIAQVALGAILTLVAGVSTGVMAAAMAANM